jgi:hypothetical protein
LPTVQACVSYGRLGTWATASAGKRWGTSGPKIGKAHLNWACSEAAVWCLRAHPPAPKHLARWENTPDQGNALTVLAHTLARAVYDSLKRQVAFDHARCFQRAWRGADEPGASRDTQGMHRPDALNTAPSHASWHARARIGRPAPSPAR